MYRHLVFPIAALIVLGIGTCLGARASDSEATAFMLSALSRAGIEVDAHDGRTLSLAYERALAERNPLFALPGVDIAQMREAIESVESIRRELIELQATRNDARLMESGLYPTDMLRELLTAEEARRAFLVSGSSEDAVTYERTLGSAIRSYRSALARFDYAFSKSVPEDVRQYAVPSAIIDRETTLATVDALDRSSSLALSRYLRRLSCIHGATEACEPGELEYASIDAPSAATPTRGQLALASDIMRALKNVPIKFDDTFGERLVLLEASACMANDPVGAPLFAIREVFPGLPESRLTPINVGNILFLHAPQGSTYAKLPYLKNFADHGIEYALAHPLIYYECPATSQDLGGVMAVRDVALFAGSHDLSAHAVGEQATALRTLEKRLASAPIVYESDAAGYLLHAASLLNDPSLQPSLKKDISELRLAFALRSGGVPYVLANIATAEMINMQQSAERGVTIDFSLRNLIYARNALPAIFLSENRSVAPDYVQLYRKNTLPPSEQPYAYYSSFAEEAGGFDTLLKSLRFYHEKLER